MFVAISENETITEAYESDIKYIIANLSKQTRAELEDSSLTTTQATQMARDFMRKGGGFVLRDDDDNPMVLFGYQAYDGYFSMWTLATQAFFDMGARGIRMSRKYFRSLRATQPILVVTKAKDQAIPRWLKLCGFDFSRNLGSAKVFTLRQEHARLI